MRRHIILITAFFLLLLLIGSPLRQIYAPFRYRPLVKHFSDKYNLDWMLVDSLVFHESRFRYKALSNKGAIGLMQIMPDTGSEIARKLGWESYSVNDLYKPIVNLEFGCYYFSRLLKEFNNDVRLALAAYNAGKGSVYRHYSERCGNLSYPSSNKNVTYSDIYRYLYPETRRYVSKVNNTYRLLKMMDRVWKL